MACRWQGRSKCFHLGLASIMMYLFAAQFKEEAFVRGYQANGLKKKSRVHRAAMELEKEKLAHDLTILCYHSLGTHEKFAEHEHQLGTRTRQLREMLGSQASSYQGLIQENADESRKRENQNDIQMGIDGKLDIQQVMDKIMQRTERASSMAQRKPIIDHVSRLSGSDLSSRIREVKDEMDKVTTVIDKLPLGVVRKAEDFIANPPPKDNWRDKHMMMFEPTNGDAGENRWKPLTISNAPHVPERDLPFEDQYMDIRICIEGSPCRTPIKVRPSTKISELKKKFIEKVGFEEMGPESYWKIVEWGHEGTPDEMLAAGHLRDDSKIGDHGLKHRDLVLMSYRPPFGA